MTRDDTIRMAREAGFGFMTEKPKSATHMQCSILELEAFAKLAFEKGRQQGMKQERALWELAKTSQELGGWQ